MSETIKYDELMARLISAAIGRIPNVALGAAAAALFAAVVASAVFKVPFYQVVNVQLAIQFGICAIMIVLATFSSVMFLLAFFSVLGSDETLAEKFGYFRMIFMPVVLMLVATVPVYSGAFTYMAYAYIFHQPLDGASFIYDWFAHAHQVVGHALHQGWTALSTAASQKPAPEPSTEDSSAWDSVSYFVLAVLLPIAQQLSQYGETGEFFYKVWTWLFPAAAAKSATAAAVRA